MTVRNRWLLYTGREDSRLAKKQMQYDAFVVKTGEKRDSMEPGNSE